MSASSPPAELSRRTRHRILLALVGCAVAARVAAAVVVGGEAFRFVDETMYTDAATGLLTGQGLSAARELPGYPAFLALLRAMLPQGVLPLRVAQAVVAALGVPLCYALGRRLGGEGAGLLAAAVFALDPLLVVSAGLLYPEAIAALLLTGAVLLAWEAVRRDRLPVSALAGMVLGLLTLFRPVSLALAPAMLGWAVLGRPGRWDRRTAHAALLLGLWAMVLAPWMYRTYRDTGHLLPTGAAVRGVPGIGAEASEVGVGLAVVKTAAAEPEAFVRRTIREFGRFWEFTPTRLASDSPERRARLAERFPRVSSEPLVRRGPRDLLAGISFGLELALALVGLALAWRGSRREAVWLVGLVLSFALGYALFYGKVRYRIPVLPILFAYAGLGAVTLLRLGWRRSRV
jgi:4-amino-4-deoxy-L-arabinose transferase-like glycosyltransferase